MGATLKLTHKAIGVEVRRGAHDFTEYTKQDRRPSDGDERRHSRLSAPQ
jgi:hypothetical protein